MIWKQKKLLAFLSLPLSLFLAGFVYSSTAHAVSVSSSNFIRAFSNATANIVVNDDNVGSKSIPYEVLTYDTTYMRLLYGVQAATSVTDNNTNKYKTLSVNFTLEQDVNPAINSNPLYSPNALFQVTAGGNTYNFACNNTAWGPNSNGGWNRWGRSWTCDAYFSNYEKITAFSVRLGNLSGNVLNSNWFAQSIPPNYNGSFSYAKASIYVTSLSYTITGTADPMIQGQQTMINQNNTIIEQNTNINNNIQDVEDAVNNLNNQQEQAGQAAQSDGDSSGAASQDAAQGGTTLLKGFQDFVAALTSASASDCIINADIGDFKMGNVDLCQISPPPAFQAISSIMVIGFVVPLSIATTRKFLSLFRSFQNG